VIEDLSHPITQHQQP